MLKESLTRTCGDLNVITAVVLDQYQMHLALVTQAGDVISRRSVGFHHQFLPGQIAQMVRRYSQAMLAERGVYEQMIGYGFALSRAYINHYRGNDGSGSWQSAVAWLEKGTREILKFPCHFTLKCNAAAIAELHYGKDSRLRDFMVVSMDEELTGSIVSNGTVVSGHSGMAGALGHYVIRPDISGSTDARRSLSSFCSENGIVDTAREIRILYPESPLCQVQAELLRAEMIYQLADDGDPAANHVLEYTGQILGEGLAAFVTFSSPASIVLRGRMIDRSQKLLDAARFHMEANLLPIYKDKIVLSFSKIHMDEVYFLGCSGLLI